MTINADMAALVGFGCEAFFYGAFSANTRETSLSFISLGCYTVLFAMSVYLMFNGPRRGNGVNRPIFIISILLYLSCSTHFALEFSHFFDVLVCTTPYRSYAITEHCCRVPQASRASAKRQTPLLVLISSSQSLISLVKLSSSTAVGCCGPRIMGSSSFHF